MKNKHIWIPAFVLIGACVVGLVYSTVDYKGVNKAPSYSSGVIQFNYDGASDGKDPNGNSFNPVSFLTDDVIENALVKSELTTYTVADVKPYISLQNIVPENIVSEIVNHENIVDKDSSRVINSNDYHPVRYRFTAYQNMGKGLSKTKLNTLLDNVIDEYCYKFYTIFKKSFVDDAYIDLLDIDNYDYTYQNQIISARLEVLMDYAEAIYEEHGDFLINGKSFKDVYLKAKALIDTDASKIHNLIVANALSKDVEKLKDYYTYLIERLNFDKTKYTSDLKEITAQVTDFEIDSTVYVGTGENVIKVESNSAETYNALLSKQIAAANKITSIEKQIAYYTNILDTLEHPIGGSAPEETVKTMIASLKEDYGDVQEMFTEMIERYNNEYILRDSIVKSKASYYTDSIFSIDFAVHTFKKSAIFVLTALLGISIYYLSRAIRKEKKAA